MPFGYLTNLGRGVQDDFRAVQPHKELRANRDFTAQAIEQAQAEADRRIAEEDAKRQEEAAAAEADRKAIADRLAGDEFAGSREREQGRSARTIEQEARAAEAWDRFAAERDQRGMELVRRSEQTPLSQEEWAKANAEEAQRVADFTAKYGAPPSKSRYARDAEYQSLQGKVKGDLGSASSSTSRRTGGSSEVARSAAEQYLMGQWGQGAPEQKDTRRDLYVAQILEGRRPDVLREMVGTTGANLVDEEIARRRGLVGSEKEENEKIVAARIRAAQGVSSSAMSAEVQSARTAAMTERNKLKDAVDQAKLAIAQGRLTFDMKKLLMQQAASAEQRSLQNLISLRNARNQGLMADIYYGTGKDANSAIYEAETDHAKIARARADLTQGLASTDPAEVARALELISSQALDPQMQRSPVMTDPTFLTNMGFQSQQQLIPGSSPQSIPVTSFASLGIPDMQSEYGQVYVTGTPAQVGQAAQVVKTERRDVPPPPRVPRASRPPTPKEFDAAWKKAKSGEKVIGPDGKPYTKK